MVQRSLVGAGSLSEASGQAQRVSGNYKQLVSGLTLSEHFSQSGQRGLNRPSEVTKLILERLQRYLFHYRKKTVTL